MRKILMVAALLGGIAFFVAPVGKAWDRDRFGIFYQQTVDDKFKISVFHDAETGQEFVCVRTVDGSINSTSGVSCHLTGRKW